MDLTPVVGVVLLLALGVDVFGTVFRGGGGPLHNAQNILVWSLLRRAVRGRSEATRARVLSAGGPMLATLTLAMWLFLLTAGFALVYAPYVLDFVYIGGEATTRWVEAVYVSAVVSSTLGFGDVVPSGPVLRVVTGLHGILGFALLGMSVTYILSIFTARSNARALALTIDSYLEQGADAAVRSEGLDDVAEWSQTVARDLLRTVQAFYDYPILHYFRPADRGSSLAVQVGPLLDLVEHMEGARAPDGRVAAARPPVLVLKRALERYLAESERVFVRRWTRGPSGDSPRALHAHLLDYLGFDDERSST